MLCCISWARHLLQERRVWNQDSPLPATLPSHFYPLGVWRNGGGTHLQAEELSTPPLFEFWLIKESYIVCGSASTSPSADRFVPEEKDLGLRPCKSPCVPLSMGYCFPQINPKPYDHSFFGSIRLNHVLSWSVTPTIFTLEGLNSSTFETPFRSTLPLRDSDRLHAE